MEILFCKENAHSAFERDGLFLSVIARRREERAAGAAISIKKRFFSFLYELADCHYRSLVSKQQQNRRDKIPVYIRAAHATRLACEMRAGVEYERYVGEPLSARLPRCSLRFIATAKETGFAIQPPKFYLTASIMLTANWLRRSWLCAVQ